MSTIEALKTELDSNLIEFSNRVVEASGRMVPLTIEDSVFDSGFCHFASYEVQKTALRLGMSATVMLNEYGMHPRGPERHKVVHVKDSDKTIVIDPTYQQMFRLAGMCRRSDFPLAAPKIAVYSTDEVALFVSGMVNHTKEFWKRNHSAQDTSAFRGLDEKGVRCWYEGFFRLEDYRTDRLFSRAKT